MSTQGIRIIENDFLTVQELSKYIRDEDITLANIKDVLSTVDSSDSMILGLFDLHLPALKKVDAVSHDNPEVVTMLSSNVTTELIWACQQTIGMKNRVDTLTTVPLLMTMNQLNYAQVEFRGGGMPGFRVSKRSNTHNNSFNDVFLEEEEEPKEIETDEHEERVVRVSPYETTQEDVVRIGVCSGLPIFTQNDIQIMDEKYGIKDIVAAAPDAINLANICAGALDVKSVVINGKRTSRLDYHQFGDPKRFALAAPYKNNVLTSGTVGKCRQNFAIPTMSKEAMVHELATFLTSHPAELQKIPRSDIVAVTYKDGYKGVKYLEMPLAHLENMWSNMRAMASRYLKLLKNFDTGFSALNAPLKWSPVLGYIHRDTPYIQVDRSLKSNDSFNRNTQMVYYGAAGGRMDAMIRSYHWNFEGRDIKEFQGTSKKVDESELKRLKVPRWNYADITAYQRGEEGLMISDVFMPAWRGKSGNAIMSKFIAGLMMGKVVSGNDSRSLGSTDNFVVAAKMMTPDQCNLVEFDGAYPFVVAFTCRPTTSEIILIKDFAEAANGFNWHEKTLEILAKNFNDVSMSSRFLIIKSRKEFEQVLKIKISSQISELFMHLDRITTDWTRPQISKRNRKWFLAAPQMPNLYRSAKVNLDLGDNSWSFDSVLGQIMDLKLDGYNLASDDIKKEDVLEGKKVKEKKEVKVKGNVTESAPLEIYNFNDPQY